MVLFLTLVINRGNDRCKVSVQEHEAALHIFLGVSRRSGCTSAAGCNGRFVEVDISSSVNKVNS